MTQIPGSIQKVVNSAIQRLNPVRIYLYGSRARGTNRPESDFDLAFEGVAPDRLWGFWEAEMQESGPTIWPMDLARFERLPPQMQETIRREGIILYEQS